MKVVLVGLERLLLDHPLQRREVLDGHRLLHAERAEDGVVGRDQREDRDLLRRQVVAVEVHAADDVARARRDKLGRQQVGVHRVERHRGLPRLEHIERHVAHVSPGLDEHADD